MNEFSLINELNQRYGLKDFQSKGFIPSLSGLGYKHKLNYVKVGNRFKNDFKELEQGMLTASILFSSYSNYEEFINFVESSNILRLVYKPVDIEYFRDIDFEGITDVVAKVFTVEAEIQLMCKSLYYTLQDTRFGVEEIEGQSQYDLRFDYVFNDYASIDVVFNNLGHIDAEMIVEFYGYIENPKIDLYQNDVLVYTVLFNKIVLENEKLIYSAQDGSNYLIFENAVGVRSNAVSSLDLASDNFFRIPRGVSKLVVSSDSGIYTKVTFQILTAFKGV